MIEELTMSVIEKDTRYDDIQMSAKQLFLMHTALSNKRIVLSDRLDKISTIFFVISIFSGLIAIFTEFWIAMLSLGFAIVGCILLIYKVKSKLANDIDIHLWLSERSRILYEDSLQSEGNVDPSIAKAQLFSIKSIIEDYSAYKSNNLTATLSEFYAVRYTRSRYTAAIKNKHNKHEIKNLM